METPNLPATPPPAVAAPPAGQPAADPLAELDTILAGVARQDEAGAARVAAQEAATAAFRAAFAEACTREAKPAMEAVTERLRRLGGDGLVVEHPGGEARFREPSLVLWMSLEDAIDGDPRPDRLPYLQLEADAATQEVQVIEGDMWRGAGGNRSGRVGAWKVDEVTAGHVTRELLAIARRAAG